jgi:hypothetical protein
LSRREEFEGIRHHLLRGLQGDDREFAEAAMRNSTIFGGPGKGPIDPKDAQIIQRAYRTVDAAEAAGHNVTLHGAKLPRGFHTYPQGAPHDPYEHPNIIATPMREGGWHFSMNAPMKETEYRTDKETMPGLFDDEVPATLHSLSQRFFRR